MFSVIPSDRYSLFMSPPAFVIGRIAIESMACPPLSLQAQYPIAAKVVNSATKARRVPFGWRLISLTRYSARDVVCAAPSSAVLGSDFFAVPTAAYPLLVFTGALPLAFGR